MSHRRAADVAANSINSLTERDAKVTARLSGNRKEHIGHDQVPAVCWIFPPYTFEYRHLFPKEIVPALAYCGAAAGPNGPLPPSLCIRPAPW